MVIGRKGAFLLFSIFCAILFSGCTDTTGNTVDINSLSSSPQVAKFLSEHPNAKTAVVPWDAALVETNLNAIRADCGNDFAISAYYKVTVTDPSFSLVAWVDQSDTSKVVCVVENPTGSKTTGSATSKPTSSSTGSATAQDCTDSDNGFAWDVFGTTKKGEVTNTDCCISGPNAKDCVTTQSDHIMEWTCDKTNGEIVSQTHDCSTEGKKCASGKCVSATETNIASCSDSDGGKDLIKQGAVSGRGENSEYSFTDTCVDDDRLKENYCVNTQPSEYTYSCKGNFGTGSVCKEGACVSTTASEFACGDKVSFTYNGESVLYGTVKSPAGKCFMERNLGASRQATKADDSEAYGDLFQWGRLDDGHQSRTSETTAELSATDKPGHKKFIKLVTATNPFDWRSGQNKNLWQGAVQNTNNNPCPTGWRLPTMEEWQAEVAAGTWKTAADAFASSLKLPVAGQREALDGVISSTESTGFYWSSTTGGSSPINSWFLDFGAARLDATEFNFDYRAHGYSVRCMKDAATTPKPECKKEGETVPVINNPPSCCEGLVLDTSTVGNMNGISGTCVKPVSASNTGFYIQNAEGKNVAVFTQKGGLILKGKRINKYTKAPDGSFSIQSGADTVAYITPDGNLYTRKGFGADAKTDCVTAPDGSFSIQNADGKTVAYIDKEGALCLSDGLTQNGNP